MKPNKTEELKYYWVKFKNGKLGISDSKVADVREENPHKPDYYPLWGRTIKGWDKMSINEKGLCVNLDTLALSAAKGQPQSETDKLIKNITDIVGGK
jgi:hypothetical protein